MTSPDEKPKLEKLKKRLYVAPTIQSEKLNSYGAVCNGTLIGGRKATTASPMLCNASRLMS